MFDLCHSSILYQLLFDKLAFYMIFNISLFQISQRKLQSTMSHIYYFILSIDPSSKKQLLSLFIFHLFFLLFSELFGFFSKYDCSVSDRIQIDPFWENTIKYLINSNFALLFSKKKLKTKKKSSNITNSICSYYSISIPLMLLYQSKNVEMIDDQKQQILNNNAKLWKKRINSPIGPLWSFMLNTNNFLWKVGLECENEITDQGRSYSDIYINISNCFFSRYSLYHGDGGVIYVNGGLNTMNVNCSMFHDCVCSQNGGAIYFFSSNSHLRMICAHRCSCGDSNLYGGHSVYSETSHLNQVEYLSVSKCSPVLSGYYSIWLASGNQKIDNTNSSMNNALGVSGFFIDHPSTSTSAHCTFSNNKVSERRCLQLYSESGTISILYANIVHNNSPSLGVVYVNRAGSRKMMYCIFHNNQNYLFCVYEGSLDVFHSFIDHSSSLFSTSTPISTTNNSLSNRMTYILQFFNSHYCNADVPLPQRTFENSPINETPKDRILRTYAELKSIYQMMNWIEISVLLLL